MIGYAWFSGDSSDDLLFYKPQDRSCILDQFHLLNNNSLNCQFRQLDPQLKLTQLRFHQQDRLDLHLSSQLQHLLVSLEQHLESKPPLLSCDLEGQQQQQHGFLCSMCKLCKSIMKRRKNLNLLSFIVFISLNLNVCSVRPQ